jgi:hypothetical protein
MVSFGELTRNNWLAVGAHLASAIVIIILYNYWSAAKTRATAETFRYQLAGPNTNATCTTTGAIPVTPDQCNTEIVFEQPKGIMSWNVIYGTIAFFLITAFAHTFYATDAFGTGSYKAAIQQGWNPYRWFEYSASASIMTILIGLVDGTRDTATLIGLALVTIGIQLCGYVSESLMRGRGSLSTFAKDAILGATASGWIQFVALWFVLLWGFSSLVADVNDKFTDASVPGWIWFVVIGQLLFYASFGVVQVIQIARRFRGESFNYAEIESLYILLSFAAKLALAGGIGYGIIFRVRDCPT